MITPNRYQIIAAAWADARAKGLSAGEAWRQASAEYEALKGEHQAEGKQKPERPPVADELDELIDLRRRPALLAHRPDLAHRLSEQVGCRGWRKTRRDDGAGWDSIILNEWQLAERLDDGDPRRELVEKAQQLADTTGIDFLAALEKVKQAEPELVEKIATYNTMIS